jgi:hypothetical protein
MTEPNNDAQRVVDALADLFDDQAPRDRTAAEEELRAAGAVPTQVGDRIARRVSAVLPTTSSRSVLGAAGARRGAQRAAEPVRRRNRFATRLLPLLSDGSGGSGRLLPADATRPIHARFRFPAVCLASQPSAGRRAAGVRTTATMNRPSPLMAPGTSGRNGTRRQVRQEPAQRCRCTERGGERSMGRRRRRGLKTPAR